MCSRATTPRMAIDGSTVLCRASNSCIAVSVLAGSMGNIRVVTSKADGSNRLGVCKRGGFGLALGNLGLAYAGDSTVGGRYGGHIFIRLRSNARGCLVSRDGCSSRPCCVSRALGSSRSHGNYFFDRNGVVFDNANILIIGKGGGRNVTASNCFCVHRKIAVTIVRTTGGTVRMGNSRSSTVNVHVSNKLICTRADTATNGKVGASLGISVLNNGLVLGASNNSRCRRSRGSASSPTKVGTSKGVILATKALVLGDAKRNNGNLGVSKGLRVSKNDVAVDAAKKQCMCSRTLSLASSPGNMGTSKGFAVGKKRIGMCINNTDSNSRNLRDGSTFAVGKKGMCMCTCSSTVGTTDSVAVGNNSICTCSMAGSTVSSGNALGLGKKRTITVNNGIPRNNFSYSHSR